MVSSAEANNYERIENLLFIHNKEQQMYRSDKLQAADVWQLCYTINQPFKWLPINFLITDNIINQVIVCALVVFHKYNVPS